MPFILEDLSPDAIIKAMEANFYRYYWPYGELPHGELHFEPDCTWFVSGVPERWFNGVVDTRFEQEKLDEQIERILAHFRQLGLPMLWSIGPGARPSNLDAALMARGLKWDYTEPGMALILDEMNEAVQPPEKFSIEPVLDLAGLQEWAGVWLAEVPDPVADRCREVIYQLGLETSRPWQTYLGRLDGKAVATIRLFYAAGIAGVHHVATLPEARRRGISTAMTVHALHKARQQGYRVAGLTSTPAGLPVYRKIGFQTYTSFSGYSWRPN